MAEEIKDDQILEVLKGVEDPDLKKDIVSLGFITPDAGTLSAKVQLYACLHCEPSRPFAANEMGHADMELVDREEFQRRIDAGEVHDPSTLVAFYRYLEIRDTGK